MKAISEKTYDSLFKLSLALKALISIGEIIAGLALTFLSYDTLSRIAFAIFGGELFESPRDFVWGYLFSAFKDFSATPQSVWAFIFLSHGIVKILLLEGLWTKRVWTYPVAMGVFALFVIYQLYQLTYTPSIFLWGITIFDVILIGLIYHEYRKGKAHIKAL